MASGKDVYYTSVLQNDENDKVSLNHKPKGLGKRHVQAFILFICLTVGYSMRAHLSISLVAMTTSSHDHCDNINSTHNASNYTNEDNINSTTHNASNYTKEDQLNEINKELINETDVCTNKRQSWSVYRTYKWNKATQEMILFSFFVGYTSMMMPMGLIAQKFGGKIPIMVALGANGLLSFLTPWMPLLGGWIAVCICRFLQGMTQAAFYPSIHTMLGRWAPLNERGRLSTYIYTGSQFGTVLAFQIAGSFAGSPIFGWPASFWLCGVTSFICFGLLAWLGAATPNDHLTISDEELTYIMTNGSADVLHKKRRTPWKYILTSSSVWGLVAAHAGSAIGYLFILTQVPIYMNKILGVDIKKNGLYSSLPYISMYFMSLLFGYLADFCVNRKVMSVANVRRLANTIGTVVATFFMIGFSFGNSVLIAVLCLILCLGTHSGVHVGFHINQIDLAPNFAGPIMALGNMVANLISLMVPVFVSNIVGDDVVNQHKWQIVFLIVGAIQIVTNLIFVTFVKAEVQEWNFFGEDPAENDYALNEKNRFSTKCDANKL